MNVPTPLHQEQQPYHISTQEKLSFGPATPRVPPISQLPPCSTLLIDLWRR